MFATSFCMQIFMTPYRNYVQSWLLQGHQVVTKVVNKCERHNVRPLTQATPPLPADRVSEALPFEISGVHFAGTLDARQNDGHIKVYAIVFTCAVKRGVHLLVPNMLTNSFLQAFRRFVARRGTSAVIYSDHANTFKKAAKELNRMFEPSRTRQRRITAPHARFSGRPSQSRPLGGEAFTNV